MALTASKHIKVAGGLIVAPKGKRMNAIPGLQMYYAAHPIPDRCSITAARAVIKYLEQIDPKEHVLFLISGGGSSLLSLPPKPIKSVDLLSATRLLLASGAKISEINCIRRHISQVAGGRLTSFMRCHADALIISDVQGNHIQDISSGCTAPDCTSFDDALQNIRLLHLESTTALSARTCLRGAVSFCHQILTHNTWSSLHQFKSGWDENLFFAHLWCGIFYNIHRASIAKPHHYRFWHG